MFQPASLAFGRSFIARASWFSSHRDERDETFGIDEAEEENDAFRRRALRLRDTTDSAA